jgi:CheY-like chemotaxis protein/AraC-like DNA-binding protein
MGGSIAVGAADLGGAAFNVSLPINVLANSDARHLLLEEDEIGAKNSIEKKDFETTINPNKPTLLIVEDNAEMLEAMRQLLVAEYSLVLARNGKIAIEALTNNANIDLIVSDIMMDELSGIDLLKHIRNEKGRLAALPVILVTAAIEEHMKLEAFRVGADSFFFKPFNGTLLKAQIENLLRRQTAIIAYRNEYYTSTPKKEWDEEIKDETLQNKWLKALEKVVEAHYTDPSLDVITIAEKMHMSLSTLNRRVKLSVGMGPSEYIIKFRLAKALMLLNEFESYSISDVCYKVGFKNVSHFTKLFKNEFGMVPSSLLKRF